MVLSEVGSAEKVESTPGTTQEPEAAIDHPVCCLPSTSNIYNVPIDLAVDLSQLEIALVKELAEKTKLKESKVINLQNEESKLKRYWKTSKTNFDKLSLLQIQKSEVAAKKQVLESNLQSIIMEKGVVENSIVILQKQRMEHISLVEAAEKDAVEAEENYEEAVQEPKS
ncbi:hypothetical protein CAEBREN_00327 [Caenorhabditis brenneri]|uniref:Uncharacterized protein n=1 Tax=Caenorhabditis brenneri TaxID=135651 RepID=G0NKC2_CAEBE|nr:hypothetical protein CAEBREN_00327 [Caenorhabditis brenneri]